MSTACVGIDCVSCLGSNGFFLKLVNSTICYVYNMSTFDLDYLDVLAPGDKCPNSDFTRPDLALGSLLTGVGFLAGCGLGILYCMQSHRRDCVSRNDVEAARAEERKNLIVNERNEPSGISNRRLALTASDSSELTPNQQSTSLVIASSRFRFLPHNDEENISNQNDENDAFEHL